MDAFSHQKKAPEDFKFLTQSMFWGWGGKLQIFKSMSPGKIDSGRMGSIFIFPINVQKEECGV